MSTARTVPPTTAGPASRRARLGAVLGVADAGVSSVGNLAVSVVAANVLDLAGFGSFSVALLVCLLVLGASRALHNEPMVLTTSASDGAERRRAASSALGALLVTSVAVAVVAAAVLLAVGRLVVDVPVLLAACAVLPVLLVQDLLRAVEYTAGRPSRALLNSLSWTLALLAGLLACHLAGVDLPAWGLLLLWGATAGAGAVVGAVTTAVRPALGGVRTWYATQRRLAARLLTDFALLQATAEGAMLAVAAVAGAREIGLLRLAQVPLGPILVLTAGLVSVMQPAAVRAIAAGATPAQVRSRAYRSGATAAGVALAASLVVWALPVSLLARVLGDSWGEARPLVPVLGVYLALGVLAACLGVSLRAAGSLPEQLRVRYVLAPVTVVVVLGGAAAGGATGAALALCASLVAIVVAWCVLLGRVTPDRLARGASR